MKLEELLNVYKKGSYGLSNGKHVLDKSDEKYKMYEVKSFSNYRHNTIRIIIGDIGESIYGY